VSAIFGFVVGIAADLGQQPPPEVRDGSVSRDEQIARTAEEWRALDPEAFRFIHAVVDEFAHHDDREQFRAGLDLLLDGLRLQAGRLAPNRQYEAPAHQRDAARVVGLAGDRAP
jgi:hypothetical protein